MTCITAPCTNSRIGAPLPLLRCLPGWTREPQLSTRAIWRRSAKRSPRTRNPCNQANLDQAERSERGNRSAAERHAQHDSREYVAKEMHAEHDARHGDAERDEKQRAL